MDHLDQEPEVNAQPQARAISVDELLKQLCERFPACFLAQGTCRPLKIGILDELAARTLEWPGVSKTRLREVLRRYTGATRYLQGIAQGLQRVGLDGDDAGQVAEEHIVHAKEQLAQRKAKRAERMKAQGQSQQGENSGAPHSRGEGARREGGRPDRTREDGAERRPQHARGGPQRERRARAEFPQRRGDSQPRPAPAAVESERDVAIAAGTPLLNQRVKVQTGARPVYGTVLAQQGESVQVGLDNGLSVWVKLEALSLATAKS